MIPRSRFRSVVVAVCAGLAIASPAGAQQPTQVPSKAPAEKVPNKALAKAPDKQPAATSSKAIAAWRGQVMTHLKGQKRNFNAGADGTSTIGFSIDRSSKVLSARLINGSGNAALDQEAVALAQRASPLPAPPNDVVGTTLNLTVPIRFKR